ncbi:MAG: response regulator [Nitrospiraceae bacterium]|nr:response regulator [Nitrospiraceae bacterium]
MMDGYTKNILLVDDEKAFLLSLSEGLSSCEENFKVFTADNGRCALNVLKNGPRIDVLVTDLKMPEMDGFELLQNISKDFPEIRVIVLTAFITPDIEGQIRAIGDYACMEKPLEFEELKGRIMGMLDYPGGTGSFFSIDYALDKDGLLTEKFLAS